MRLVLAEACTALRRLSRRRSVRVVGLLDLVAIGYAGLAAPVGTVRAALSTAAALGALTLLVLASGIVADDRAAGSLEIAATHPVPPVALVVGRWLAVVAGAAGVATAGGVLLAAGGPGVGHPAALALGLAAAVLHLAALGALALLLSCGAGPTAQILILLGVLVAGVVPPDLAAQTVPWAWLRPAVRALWVLLPTPWILDRLQNWALGLGAAAPLLLAALLAQAPAYLAAGSRMLSRAQLGLRAA